MTTTSKWHHPDDDRILRDLRDNGPDYVPLVAARLGMHVGYVERRVTTLVEEGLLEAVSDEVVYWVTDSGRRYLADGPAAARVDGDD